jgi:DNA-binding NarL/FixJ family response regulator
MRQAERAREVDQYGFPSATTPIKVLLLADKPKEKSRMHSITKKDTVKVNCVSTIAEALVLLRDERFDVVIVDRHLGGWLSPQACKALRSRAGHIPVVGLINEECVLDLRDGIEAGLMGVYYKDQIDVHLIRRLGQLAHLPRVGISLKSSRRDDLI